MGTKLTAKVAVVVTVFNERHTIGQLVSALVAQTLTPSEIVIVDGGSTDGTWEWLKSKNSLKVYQKKGNRSVGRNFGVHQSTSQLIAFTDAGCIPQSDWLEQLIKPFSQGAQVVSGYYRGRPQTIFQRCLIPFVLIMPDKAFSQEFFPSTRSMAITRQAWNKSGGFHESLHHNEDYAFAHHLKKIGYSFVFAPNAIVSWLPRKNLTQAAWMFTRYALGDIQAGILRPQVKLLALRYLVATFIFFLTLEIFPPFSIIYLLFSIFIYSLWAIAKNYRYVRHPIAFFWLPVIQFTADFSVLFGTTIGYLSKMYLS